ncbi:DNA cytosine methyltransferase [Amycolatopsis sp., V23-08]|uniref:DNA (cytosine-5-)-methyltransferase n=1 Tax=Amycolatopsis heterodermiae TaxID=3110235 RepID=A0ABU5R217_9PSEU|nr:DNA cytosine methyltransferase [Amycolatopsis sp., V23-08]MEA5359704.1 DNA cytosine methyltransferase [Amycolatopsis sp., V23-08]
MPREHDSKHYDSPGKRYRSLELCAGAGGLALGLEQAGFDPVLLLDNVDLPCKTLSLNRPQWDIQKMDLREFDPAEDDERLYDVDLLSAGLPRVQASATVNRGRGSDVELELLRAAVWLVPGIQPRALLIENVPDLVTKDRYANDREHAEKELEHLGYDVRWFVVNAADYGVSQVRRHGIMVAFKGGAGDTFRLPQVQPPPPSVGAVLRESMASRGWSQVDEWAAQADQLAPTLVGGSWDRGGADLGPTGSKHLWAKMGVNGGTVADLPPDPDFRWDPNLGPAGMVRLTVPQVALLQGFPSDWQLSGRKTNQYRQVGNATPPPVGRALGQAIRGVLERS